MLRLLRNINSNEIRITYFGIGPPLDLLSFNSGVFVRIQRLRRERVVAHRQMWIGEKVNKFVGRGGAIATSRLARRPQAPVRRADPGRRTCTVKFPAPWIAGSIISRSCADALHPLRQ